MLQNYLKIAWRNLLRNKMYSLRVCFAAEFAEESTTNKIGAKRRGIQNQIAQHSSPMTYS